MPSVADTIAVTDHADLPKQVADALQDDAVPISQLLRLFWALNAQRGAANGNDVLRLKLRARIGAPFPD